MVLSRDRFGTSAATIGPGEVEPRCGGDIEPGSAGVSAAAERLLSAERQAGSAASPLARTPRRQSRRQSPLHLGSTSAPSRQRDKQDRLPLLSRARLGDNLGDNLPSTSAPPRLHLGRETSRIGCLSSRAHASATISATISPPPRLHL